MIDMAKMNDIRIVLHVPSQRYQLECLVSGERTHLSEQDVIEFLTKIQTIGRCIGNEDYTIFSCFK